MTLILGLVTDGGEQPGRHGPAHGAHAAEEDGSGRREAWRRGAVATASVLQGVAGSGSGEMPQMEAQGEGCFRS